MKKRHVGLIIYFGFLLLPIYWLFTMSLKTNVEITGSLTLWPQQLTFANYVTILTDPTWYSGYINSFIYVAMNTVISLSVACRRPMPSRATGSSATSTSSSGC
jgi:glycerol transport system permease protein